MLVDIGTTLKVKVHQHNSVEKGTLTLLESGLIFEPFKDSTARIDLSYKVINELHCTKFIFLTPTSLRIGTVEHLSYSLQGKHIGALYEFLKQHIL